MTLKSHVSYCEAIGTLCAIVRCLRKLSYTGIRWIFFLSDSCGIGQETFPYAFTCNGAYRGTRGPIDIYGRLYYSSVHLGGCIEP